MAFVVRDYQAKVMGEVRDRYARGVRRILMCCPTGAGKSAMTGYMLGRTKKRTLILCHRLDLLEMISRSLPVPHGLILPGKKTPQDQVLVGMIQTVQRRLDELPPFEWVISDECHFSMSDGWSRTLRFYDKAWHLGMSATPCRLDGRPLGTLFDEIIYGPSVRELIERGYLVPARVFAPPSAGTDEIGTVGGEFDMAEAARVFGAAKIVGDTVEHLVRHGQRRPAIVFCCTRDHAADVARRFRERGFAAASIDGSMSVEQRHRIMDQFRRRQIQVLANVELLTTGVDVPLAEAAVFLRPTQSLALWLQMCGRVLRTNLGKTDALILDHVGNTMRHGLPDDEREWSLEGRIKRAGAPPVKQCPACFCAHRPAPACPQCEYAYPVAAAARVVRQIDGELSEVSREHVERIRKTSLKALLKEAQTEVALREIARVKGYKRGWVQHVLKARGRYEERSA